MLFLISGLSILFGITAFTTTSSSLYDRAQSEYAAQSSIQEAYDSAGSYQDAGTSDLNRLKIAGIITIPIAVAVMIFALRLRSSVKRSLTQMQHQTERVAATQQRAAHREKEVARYLRKHSSPNKPRKSNKKQKPPKSAAKYSAAPTGESPAARHNAHGTAHGNPIEDDGDAADDDGDAPDDIEAGAAAGFGIDSANPISTPPAGLRAADATAVSSTLR